MLRQVDIGYRVAVDVAAGGEPPVVFVAGVQDRGAVWDDVVSHLHEGCATYTYDRPALGDSEPLPNALAAQTVGCNRPADELGNLLEAISAPTPRVLVGHSIGALIAAALAARQPSDCAGLVLVDASHPALFVKLDGFEQLVRDAEGGTAFDWRQLHAEFEQLAFPERPATVVACAVGRWLRESDPSTYAPMTLAAVDDTWQTWQGRLAARLDADLRIAANAGHRVHVEDPVLVAQAIDDTVAAAVART